MSDTERRVIAIAEVDRSRSDGSQGTARVGVKDTGGKWYSCFDAKLWPRLEAGASLSCETRANGKYTNIVGILGTGASANGTAPVDGGRERRIQAECAAKCATEILKTMPTLDDAALTRERWASVAGWVLDWLLSNDGQTRPTDEPF